MIPRTLIPVSLLPGALTASPGKPRRFTTNLDQRIIVPPDLPVVPLDAKSFIPTHVPLEVLGERILVPRDTPVVPLVQPREGVPPRPSSRLDSRITVPRDARPAELKIAASLPPQMLGEMVEPDIFTTGEVTLMARPIDEVAPRWGWQAIASSILFHAVFIALLLLQPKLFPYRPPTEKEVEMAHRSLGLVYIPPPPPITQLPPSAVPPPPPKIRIDPRVFERIAPPDQEASPNPGPGALEGPRAERDLTAPPPRSSGAEPGGGRETKEAEPPREVARFEPPKAPEPIPGLTLRPSPGKLLQDSIRGAAKKGGTTGMEFGDELPSVPGGAAAGGGRGYAGGAVQILTPTEGVDFTNYIARMLASVRRNWYAVIPESARLGDRGMVVLDFAVQRDGGVPSSQPFLMRGSGREPLDRAAISAIRASNPFEPLPPAFTGPEVKFRFIFLYNMRLEQ